MAPNPRIDGWFLCIAPLENPQIAMAVIVEGGGYGSRSAAPIAAQLVLRARDLGLLGGGAPKNAPKNPNEADPNKRRQPPKPRARR
jgi:hypothetical protein